MYSHLWEQQVWITSTAMGVPLQRSTKKGHAMLLATSLILDTTICLASTPIPRTDVFGTKLFKIEETDSLVPLSIYRMGI